METLLLEKKLKSTGTAYLFLFLFGAHYIYLGQVGKQILFWVTLGGLGVWFFIDIFTLGDKVKAVNLPIIRRIQEMNKEKKDDQFKKDMMLMNAMNNK